MNRDFASSLIQLNNTFYREHSASFSDTRQAPWPGWVRTMDIALEQLDVATIEHPVRVFDLACGNMRFENFAAGGALAAKGVDGANPSADASCPFEFYGVDSCQDLAIDAHGHALRIPNLHFQELDVLDALMKLNPAETPDVLFDAPLTDISVCFGFMHHVPSCEYRVRVLDALVRQTRPGGIIAISFWEFMNDERMARKAVRAEARAGCGAVVTLQSTPAQIAAGAPERHCAALRGFASSLDGEPKVLLCDPYAAAEDFDCEIEMPLDDFMVAWDNVALLMRQRKSSTPPQGRTRCSAWIRPVGTDAPGVYRLYLNGEEHPLPDDFCAQGGVLAYSLPDEHPHATTAHRQFSYVEPTQGGILLEHGDTPRKYTVYAIGTDGRMIVGDVTV